MKFPKCNSSLLVFEPFIRTFSPLARSAFTSKYKVRKRGTFSEVIGISTVATVDSGRRPENPPTFEKVGSKLSTCDSAFFCYIVGYRAGAAWSQNCRPLFDEDGNIYDVIAGTFLVVGLTEDDFGSLTDEQIHRYTDMFIWGF